MSWPVSTYKNSIDCSDSIPLQPIYPRAPVVYRAIVIANLSSVSPEEHSLIIRDVPPDVPDQFRVYCLAQKKR